MVSPTISPDEQQRSPRGRWPAILHEIATCRCHGPEWAIDCMRCGRRALAWYSRPRLEDTPGWSCVCGARGALWELRGAA